MRFGIDRYVLYLPMPLETLQRLDGAREQRIRTKIEQFRSSPPGAIEKEPTPHIAQVKDRNSKMRAFATWCELASFDCFIVQAIYRKRNEDDFWADLSVYSERGGAYQARLDALTNDEAHDWLTRTQQRADILVVGP